jgi:hypothetical protein
MLNAVLVDCWLSHLGKSNKYRGGTAVGMPSAFHGALPLICVLAFFPLMSMQMAFFIINNVMSAFAILF